MLLKEVIMGATSVTCVGLGDSHGKQKPDNHCTCSGPKVDVEEKEPAPKRGCITRYKAGSSISYKSGGSTRTKVCS